jgi:hypothetical protein
MRTIKGPGLLLAQFARDTPPQNTLEGIARWAKGYGMSASRRRRLFPALKMRCWCTLGLSHYPALGSEGPRREPPATLLRGHDAKIRRRPPRA